MQIDIMQSRHFSRNLVAERPLMRQRGLQPPLKGLWMRETKGGWVGRAAGGGDSSSGPGKPAEPAGDARIQGAATAALSINGFV